MLGPTESAGFTPAARFLLIAAAFVIVVAGLKASSNLLTPFLLAVFIAVVVQPPIQYLRRRSVPGWLAIALVVAVLFGVGGAVVALFTNSLNALNASLPEYQGRLRILIDETLSWLDQVGVHLSKEAVSSMIDPARLFGLLGRFIKGLGGVVTNAFLILVTVIFILLEANNLPQKLRAALQAPEGSILRLREVLATINGYMFIKANTSLATGLLIWLWLRYLDVDFAAVWATLAFLLNFVPTIGSIIAAIPAILLALVQHGFQCAAEVTGGFMLVNIMIGSFIEPRIMGRGLGLSALIVFVSLVFWGYVLGPAGMFLAVPLTMTLKIALDTNPQTRPFAIMLGPEIEARRAVGAAQINAVTAEGHPASAQPTHLNEPEQDRLNDAKRRDS